MTFQEAIDAMNAATKFEQNRCAWWMVAHLRERLREAQQRLVAQRVEFEERIKSLSECVARQEQDITMLQFHNKQLQINKQRSVDEATKPLDIRLDNQLGEIRKLRDENALLRERLDNQSHTIGAFQKATGRGFYDDAAKDIAHYKSTITNLQDQLDAERTKHNMTLKDANTFQRLLEESRLELAHVRDLLKEQVAELAKMRAERTDGTLINRQKAIETATWVVAQGPRFMTPNYVSQVVERALRNMQ
jgi:hypothetical protein